MTADWFETAMNLPGATLDNVTDPDVIGTYGLEWDRDGEPTPPRCRCSHARSQHWSGESGCWISVCGCSTYRHKETK